MKNLTFVILVVLMSNAAFAQQGLKFGLQFTPGTTLCLQSEDFDRGEDLDLEPVFGYNFGLTVGYGFSETFSVSTGLMFNQHVSGYVHNREFLASVGGISIDDPNHKKRFSRTLGYFRIPILLEISGDPTATAGFFFRVGPHFDFFTGGAYRDERMNGTPGYDETNGINLREKVDLYEKATLVGVDYARQTGETGKVYSDVVIGLSLDVGAQVSLSEMMKLIITVHLESSLSNPEAEGAASFANTYGAATYPNYTSESDRWATSRAQAWNIMGGLTLGVRYTLPID